MNNNFDRIETHLRKLFEESLLKFFTGDQQHITLIEDLINVMDENLQEGQDGGILAPDRFVLHVPPEDLLNWQAHQDFFNELASSIHEIGQSEGFLYQQPPSIALHSNPEIQQHQFSISAHHSIINPSLPDTAAMVQSEQNHVDTLVPENAFLVIGGKTNFPLEKSVINIGRHSDNDLVLENPHISRHHAQLRAINNHYVIFDVGSTGGIFLNGKRIPQATLQAGDVIRMGTINLIYVQDTTSANPTTVMEIDTENNLPGDNAE